MSESPVYAPSGGFGPNVITAPTFGISRMECQTITFAGIVSINSKTGEVTIAPGYTPDDAAKAFWDAVKRMAPNLARADMTGEGNGD